MKHIPLTVGCPIKRQIRVKCAPHPSCHRTCNSSGILPCPAICIINGCVCPPGTVIDEEKNECVVPRKCSTSMCNNNLHVRMCMHACLLTIQNYSQCKNA